MTFLEFAYGTDYALLLHFSFHLLPQLNRVEDFAAAQRCCGLHVQSSQSQGRILKRLNLKNPTSLNATE